ncbi:AzlD domain-containing protein [Actinomadura graeca]|uniref:AzlD domain-containing protein n=1 Tax=Actinomadura graeca TaxID=2750812 RepID=A0ABX8QUT5_9ACTN|nr:AzlD domain-containing protein [Actinomadura graeca]QXJ22398.1 AzlD domain-containing protein [Actinomadura graeca]
MTLWPAIAAVAAINVLFKAAGPTTLGGRELPRPVLRVIAMLAPALLAALIVVEVAGPRWDGFDWTVTAGLGGALGARLLRAPELPAILCGVAVTAALRLAF